MVEKLTCFHSFFISSRVSSSACSRVAATLIPSSRVMKIPNSSLKIFRNEEPELGVMSNPMTWLIWFQCRWRMPGLHRQVMIGMFFYNQKRYKIQGLYSTEVAFGLFNQKNQV